MELLFKREQSSVKIGRVAFKLWAKTELDETETALVKRYRFDEAVLMSEDTPNLKRNAALVGLIAAIGAYLLIDRFLPASFAAFMALIAWGAAAFWWHHEKRETIFVRDLLHGRHFSCPSVIDLAKREVMLTNIVTGLRQEIETAKHWDGVERHLIPVLPKEEARALVATF